MKTESKIRSGDLLGCPHCGSAAKLTTTHPELPNGSYDTLFRVECTLRECGARTRLWFPEMAAKKAWNRRQPNVKLCREAGQKGSDEH